MDGAGVRNKGHNGEREVCSIINKHFGKQLAKRNVDQVRKGGADIVSIKPFAIEVKRQQQLNLNAWKKQAISQTNKKNPVPVLMYRRNREKWTVLVDARYMLRKKLRPTEAGHWVQIEMETFLLLISSV